MEKLDSMKIGRNSVVCRFK